MLIDLKVSNYFPFNYMIIGYGMIAASVALIFINLIWVPVFLLLGLLVVTTHYRLSVNFDQNYFYEYLWILGMKRGQKFSFDRPKSIYINATSREIEYGGLAIRRYGAERKYRGYIKFHGQKEPAFFGESVNLEGIQKKGAKLSNYMGLDIQLND